MTGGAGYVGGTGESSGRDKKRSVIWYRRSTTTMIMILLRGRRLKKNVHGEILYYCGDRFETTGASFEIGGANTQAASLSCR